MAILLKLPNSEPVRPPQGSEYGSATAAQSKSAAPSPSPMSAIPSLGMGDGDTVIAEADHGR